MTEGSAPVPRVPVVAIVGAVLRHPTLWFAALRQWKRMAPKGWWRTRPFLPVPPADYLEFRLVTQYGGGHGAERPGIDPEDVVDYLRWCKTWKDGR